MYLAIESARYTFLTSITNFDDSSIHEVKDSVLLNLLIFVVGVLVFFLLSKLLFGKTIDKAQKAKRFSIVSIVISALVFIILTIWVLKTLIPPYWDQMQVYLDAQNFNNGDYSDMEYSYLIMYPQQYGLIFFESILLKICNHYGFLQCLNALFIGLSVFFVGRLSYEVSQNYNVGLFGVIITALCFPLHYYVSFVYGDVFLVFSMLFVSWLILRGIQRNRIGYLLGALGCAICMVPIRMNSLIFMVALFIILILSSLKLGKPLLAVFAPLFIILPIISNKGILLYYEKVSNIEIGNDEIPTINWVVMGLQGEVYEGNGVGYYNGYNYASWNMNDKNKQKSIESSKQVLSERIEEFKSDPQMALDFFRYKALEQWIDPFFDSVQMTFGSADYQKVRLLYNSVTLSILQYFLNYYMTFVYGLSFIFIVYAIKHDREYKLLLPLVVFIGGFLFSLIWEAKGRYTFPFFVMLIPSSALALGKIHELAISLFYNRKGKKSE